MTLTQEAAAFVRRVQELERRLRSVERGTRLDRASVPVVVDPEVDPINLDVAGALFSGVEAGVDAAAALDTLQPSKLDPKLLSVGVNGNLIQDSRLATNLRDGAVQPPWLILGPDTVYTDSRYLRSTQTTQAPTYVVLTTRFEVAIDQVMSATVEIRPDAAAVAANCKVGLNVAWFTTQDEAGIGDDDDWYMWVATDTPADQWTTLRATFTPPEGKAWGQLEVFTQYQDFGVVDFARPTAQIVGNRVQSANYVEGWSGFKLDEDTSQFADVSITGQLGAAIINADKINLASEDLADKLALIPKGSRFATRGGPGNVDAGPVAATELRLFTFAAGDLTAGQTYRISVRALGNGTVAGDTYWIRLRYTTDNADAGLTSPSLVAHIVDVMAGNRAVLDFSYLFSPPADMTLKLAVTGMRRSGTGTLSILLSSADTAFQISVTPIGVDAGGGEALQQTAKVDGSGSDNPAITTYTKTFPAVWAKTYESDGLDSDSSGGLFNGRLYQGADADFSPNGSLRGLVGFNNAAIAAALGSAVEVVGCYLTYTTAWRKTAAGLDVQIGTHNFASQPGDWDVSNAAALGVSFAQVMQANCVPGSTYKTSLGAAIGQQFKAGTRKGFVFAANSYSADRYGYMHGLGAKAPVLTLVYRA